MMDTQPADFRSLPVPPPNMVVEVYDEQLGHIGYVVIDRPVKNTVSGGVRYLPGESVGNLARIARAMTLKWAFLNVPMGGAKGLIDVDPAKLGCERTHLMESFGRSIQSLVNHQLYFPGIDLGTTSNDLRAIMQGVGLPFAEKGQIDASYATALTAFETVRQVVGFHSGSLTGLRVALEGFGKVGSRLAEMLYQSGAKLVAISTVSGGIRSENGLDISRLLDLKKQYGGNLVLHYPEAQVIDRTEVFTQDVDVLIPGAQVNAIHSQNIDQIKARFVLPFSNVPIELGLEAALVERGIVYLPDFVSNCGGVFAVHMRSHYFNMADVEAVVQTAFAKVVVALLQRASNTGIVPYKIAESVAWGNHHELNNPSDSTVSKANRIKLVLLEQGMEGVKRRLGWRVHYNQRGGINALRVTARERYAEFTLEQTLQRLQAT